VVENGAERICGWPNGQAAEIEMACALGWPKTGGASGLGATVSIAVSLLAAALGAFGLQSRPLGFYILPLPW